MWKQRAVKESPSAVDREVQCPLCGNKFKIIESPACQYCPMIFRSCGMVSCPRCGHEFPR